MPLTENVPKPMLDVAGHSLLERIITICAGAGFEEVVLVVGHHAGVVDRWVESTPQPLPVKTVLNDKYDTINNGHSLLVARDAVGHRNMVKFDGDLVLEPRILDRLLASPFPTALTCDTGVALAVCSTSNERAVQLILEKILGAERKSRFSAILAGDVVSKKKPDPEIYELAKQHLGLNGEDCVVVEDSRNGLLAATGAGMHCLVTTTAYTADEDFREADGVVSELGDPPGEVVTLESLSQMTAS